MTGSALEHRGLEEEEEEDGDEEEETLSSAGGRSLDGSHVNPCYITVEQDGQLERFVC